MKFQNIGNRVLKSILVLVCAFNTLGQDVWTTKTADLHPSSSSSSAVIDDLLYLVGYDSLQVYDPGSDSWTLKSAPPAATCYTSAATIGHKLYLVGGAFNCDDNSTTASIRIYDPAADSWSTGPSMSVNRTATACAAIGGKLYIVGGNGGYPYHAFHQLDIYDPATGQVSAGAPIPQAVSGATGAAINGKFYVAGGASINETYPLNILQIYDPATDSWSSGAPMFSGLYSGAGGVIDGKLHLVGGYTDTMQVNTSLEIYDPIENSWSFGPSPTFARIYGAAGVIDSSLYVADGMDPDGTPDGALLVFGPPPAVTFAFTGFLPPLNGADATGGTFGNPLRTFKMGSTIPVKFALASAAAAITTGSQTLQAVKYSNATTAGAPLDASPQGAATSGDRFQFVEGHWHFNLDTKATGMSVGIWQLRATLSDGSQHIVWIQLK